MISLPNTYVTKGGRDIFYNTPILEQEEPWQKDHALTSGVRTRILHGNIITPDPSL
jgi:hypothetical protein